MAGAKLVPGPPVALTEQLIPSGLERGLGRGGGGDASAGPRAQAGMLPSPSVALLPSLPSVVPVCAGDPRGPGKW